MLLYFCLLPCFLCSYFECNLNYNACFLCSFAGDYPAPRAVLTGHDYEVVCVSVCAELGIVISGAKGEWKEHCGIWNNMRQCVIHSSDICVCQRVRVWSTPSLGIFWGLWRALIAVCFPAWSQCPVRATASSTMTGGSSATSASTANCWPRWRSMTPHVYVLNSLLDHTVHMLVWLHW